MTPQDIRAERKRRGLTLPQAAEQIGISQATLWRYENGATNPRGLMMRALVAWMGRES